MPQPAFVTTARNGLNPPEECQRNPLVDAVSSASLSFVAGGAAVADFGGFLRDLRLALQVSLPQAPNPERARAAALLALRLDSVRGALDGATAAVNGLLAECVPASAGPPSGPPEQQHAGCARSSR